MKIGQKLGKSATSSTVKTYRPVIIRDLDGVRYDLTRRVLVISRPRQSAAWNAVHYCAPCCTTYLRSWRGSQLAWNCSPMDRGRDLFQPVEKGSRGAFPFARSHGEKDHRKTGANVSKYRSRISAFSRTVTSDRDVYKNSSLSFPFQLVETIGK